MSVHITSSDSANIIIFYRGDFGVPSIVNLLDMVKVFTFAVDQGKVAVHCHAGLGEL